MDNRKFVNTICNAKLAITVTIPPRGCGPWVVHWGCSHLPHIFPSLFSWFIYPCVLEVPKKSHLFCQILELLPSTLSMPLSQTLVVQMPKLSHSQRHLLKPNDQSILSQKYLLEQSKMLTRTVIWKSRVPIKVVNGPTITVTYHEIIIKNLDETRHVLILLDEMGLDEMGINRSRGARTEGHAVMSVRQSSNIV